jgi:uncharacterized membrane protein
MTKQNYKWRLSCSLGASVSLRRSHQNRSVRPSVRVWQFKNRWTNLHKIWHLGILLATVEANLLRLQLDKQKGHFAWWSSCFSARFSKAHTRLTIIPLLKHGFIKLMSTSITAREKHNTPFITFRINWKDVCFILLMQYCITLQLYRMSHSLPNPAFL